MASTTNIARRKLEIPLLTFRDIFDEQHTQTNIVYGNFATIPAAAAAAFPHRHDFYGILYMTGGKGTHFIDFNAYPINAGTLYFISPGQVHYWNTSAPLEGEMIAFTEDFLLLAPSDYMVLHEFSFFHSIEGTPALELSSTDSERVEPLIRSIATEFQEKKFRSDTVLRAYLHILLVDIQRIYTSHEGTPNAVGSVGAIPKLVRHFKQLVAKQFITERSVQAYADQLGVTLSHLNNTVKAVTGQTPGQLIRQEVVLESKRLFTHTDLTSAEVGYRLSFDDPSYFSRFFRRETTMSTMQYRKSIAKN
jgi:AraC-like DNA-binding protein